MNKWERITRRLLVLCEWGYNTEHFYEDIDDPNFLEDEWLEKYFGYELDRAVADQLAAIDLLSGSKQNET